jgi:hypothetical protein
MDTLHTFWMVSTQMDDLEYYSWAVRPWATSEQGKRLVTVLKLEVEPPARIPRVEPVDGTIRSHILARYRLPKFGTPP